MVGEVCDRIRILLEPQGGALKIPIYAGFVPKKKKQMIRKECWNICECNALACMNFMPCALPFLADLKSRQKELNFANIEKEELENSIRTDEDIVAGLERAAMQLADEIEIANLNRLNMRSEVARQKVRCCVSAYAVPLRPIVGPDETFTTSPLCCLCRSAHCADSFVLTRRHAGNHEEDGRGDGAAQQQDVHDARRSAGLPPRLGGPCAAPRTPALGTLVPAPAPLARGARGRAHARSWRARRSARCAGRLGELRPCQPAPLPPPVGPGAGLSRHPVPARPPSARRRVSWPERLRLHDHGTQPWFNRFS